jgi:hypothetical protein
VESPEPRAQVGRKDVEGMMHGHAHEPFGSVIMIFCRLKLNRYRRIVNQNPMLANTHHVAIPISRISRTQSLRQGFCLARNACAAIALTFLFWGRPAFAQISSEDAPRPIVAQKQGPPSEQVSSGQIESDLSEGQQSSSVTTSP